MGSVRFSGGCEQPQRVLNRDAKCNLHRRAMKKPASARSCGGAVALAGPGCRGWRKAAAACMHDEALRGMHGRLQASRRTPARRGEDSGQRRAVDTELLDHAPAPELAMRAALDLDGGHAPHEGVRVIARLRVRRWHRQ